MNFEISEFGHVAKAFDLDGSFGRAWSLRCRPDGTFSLELVRRVHDFGLEGPLWIAVFLKKSEVDVKPFPVFFRELVANTVAKGFCIGIVFR